MITSMQNLSDLTKAENLHHFNIVENGSENGIKEICANVLNFESKANPNYFYQNYDTFLIDDARDLVEKQNRKNKAGEKTVYVLECGAINAAAQNSLLKVFEETHVDTYYFLIIPQSNVLLPTFLSRAVLYRDENIQQDNHADNQDDNKNVVDFPNLEDLQKMSIKDRMDAATKWLDLYKKEKIQKSDIKKFLNNLTTDLNKEVLEGKKDFVIKLQNINEKIEFFDNNGAHLKSILEFIMLTI
jgi:DNA polymerase III delta prime subunit